MLNIPWELRVTLIAGSVLFLGAIFVLLKRKKLNVQYSIIWLCAALVMLLFAVFPYLVAGIGGIINIEMPVNLVFLMLFAFVLLLLLSLSTIVTGFSLQIKRLTQYQALLEERIRALEQGAEPRQAAAPDAPGEPGEPGEPREPGEPHP